MELIHVLQNSLLVLMVLSQQIPKLMKNGCNKIVLLSKITNTLSAEALKLVIGCETSMEVWTTLKQQFAPNSEFHIMRLKSILQNIRKGSDSIDKYLLRFINVRNNLAVVGVSMSDQDIKMLILAGLPNEYAHTRQIIRGKDHITMEEVRSLLLSAEFELELEQKGPPFSPMNAMVANNVGYVGTSPRFSSNEVACSVPNAPSGFIVATPGPIIASSTSYMPTGVTPQVGVFSNNAYVQSQANTVPNNYPQFPNNNNSRNGGNNNINSNSGSYFKPRFNSNQDPLKCQICEKPGHSAYKCFQRNPQKQGEASSSTVECHICKKSGHTTKTCR
ncbi:putative transcription factor interactor and regulator CCHC(Zn) family [Rosa chinensis]|uniref:Putative transcription factor interactor and regulator CCHC(Zn) family n=1 Tax=Rosa chinensis TaxID=74649 RepID=A0A2P6SKF2_ROSCH|nr:putative transcription factor interactor and regulator CCHC(Zn) family [Rosa chinensis]